METAASGWAPLRQSEDCDFKNIDSARQDLPEELKRSDLHGTPARSGKLCIGNAPNASYMLSALPEACYRIAVLE